MIAARDAVTDVVGADVVVVAVERRAGDADAVVAAVAQGADAAVVAGDVVGLVPAADPWFDITRRNSRSVQTTIGWIFWDPGAARRYETLGLRGIKLHPSMQIIAADAPPTMELYPACERLRLPVFFHSGRTGLEVANQADFVSLDHYEAPVREFPNLDFVLGHSGAVLDFDAAIALARDCPNVWLCLAGPSVPALERLVAELGPERLLFGSDWPFYPMAYQLSKVLIATRCDPTVRDLMLSGNAERFLAKWA